MIPLRRRLTKRSVAIGAGALIGGAAIAYGAKKLFKRRGKHRHSLRNQVKKIILKRAKGYAASGNVRKAINILNSI